MGSAIPIIETTCEGDGFGLGIFVIELDEGGAEIPDDAVVEPDAMSGGIGDADEAPEVVMGVGVASIEFIVFCEGLETGFARDGELLKFEAGTVLVPEAVSIWEGGIRLDTVVGTGGGGHICGPCFGVSEFPVGAIGVVDFDDGLLVGIVAVEADFPEVIVAPVTGGAEGGGESAEVTAGAEAFNGERSRSDGGGHFEVGYFAPNVAGKGIEEIGAAGIAAGIGGAWWC